jgi:HAE1 family hydrophobic/amphiphilic exporter-1
VGSSLEYTRSKGLEITRYLNGRSEVAYTYLTIGGEAHNKEVNRGTVFVKMVPRHERKLSQQKFETDIRKVLPRFTGSQARILQGGAVGGESAPIVINLNGPDLKTLQRLSDQALDAIRDVPGLVELKSSLEGRKPEVLVDVNRELAAQVGLSVGQVGATLRPVLSGEIAGDWEDPNGLSHDVVVRMAPESRESRNDLLRTPVATSQVDPRTGAMVMVPLSQVATLAADGAPAQIDRQKLERVASIEGNFQGRPLTDITRDIETRLKAMKLPPGYCVRLRRRAGRLRRDGGLHERVPVDGGHLPLHHPRQPVRQLPHAARDHAVTAAVAGGRDECARADARIAQHHEHDRHHHADGPGDEERDPARGLREPGAREGARPRGALVDAGELRLRPIIMTTLAMIFGMLPTALALGAGAEFRAPMAHAVIGGLITSTLLTLVVVPVVYTFLDDFGAWCAVWAGEVLQQARSRARGSGPEDKIPPQARRQVPATDAPPRARRGPGDRGIRGATPLDCPAAVHCPPFRSGELRARDQEHRIGRLGRHPPAWQGPGECRPRRVHRRRLYVRQALRGCRRRGYHARGTRRSRARSPVSRWRSRPSSARWASRPRASR